MYVLMRWLMKCKGCKEGRITANRTLYLRKGDYVLPYGVRPTKEQKAAIPVKCGGSKKVKK